ncbi:MFS transporter [Colwellia psychrerythraea]|uniref:Major facilitator superfamily MFS_1 n=1 Tax=Colwellia psychrerythraea TaxID=28229 RepID=A0A099KRC9_COLPS|nr:MFS transporter [Colwellia psychrerythraea]KGJ93314.1 major facilitator superfamily MFS_1 [Colwellia psychrerythraea]
MSSKDNQQKPRLSFWQIWNVSFGFLGVQFGFALQNANASRILSDLGADLHSLSLFWLVAPIMGLLIQPIVGSASDKTWNKLGRRNPYILAGGIAAAIGMLLMPNSATLASFITPLFFGAMMLALMDASFNLAFQPFRALVSDMVPSEQRTVGYSIQSFLINIGAVFGSILPFVLTNVIGLENTAEAGTVAPSVIWAFYIGATVMLGSVLWTVFRTKEYTPGTNGLAILEKSDTNSPLSEKLAGFFGLMKTMPTTMRQLALVQFFSWFALFIMWVYTMPAIAQHIWGIDAKWFDPSYLTSVGAIPEHIAKAKGTAGDWVGIIFAAYSLFAAIASIFMAKVANTIGRKLTYSLSLLAGGIGYISIMFIQSTEPTLVNLAITEITVPQGAVSLFLPMIGVGMAWAAILAMPYAILAGSLPVKQTGVYMGIFNFTIAAPQIVSGIFAGWILTAVFDNQAIYIIMLAGGSMILAALSVYFVKDGVEEKTENHHSEVTA